VSNVARSGSRWTWALAVGATAAAAAFLMTHAPHGASLNGTPPPAAEAGDGLAGTQAPDFQLSALDGRLVRLSDLRGRVVLVNFWATWCAPCRVEMPWLAEFDSRYRILGLTVLGVSVDDGGRERVATFVRERRVSYPILLKDQDVELRFGGVRFLPQTFFVGRDGKIIRRVYGIRTRADFEADIRSALGLQSPQA
jgi:peroxiredoxin